LASASVRELYEPCAYARGDQREDHDSAIVAKREAATKNRHSLSLPKQRMRPDEGGVMLEPGDGGQSRSVPEPNGGLIRAFWVGYRDKISEYAGLIAVYFRLFRKPELIDNIFGSPVEKSLPKICAQFALCAAIMATIYSFALDHRLVPDSLRQAFSSPVFAHDWLFELYMLSQALPTAMFIYLVLRVLKAKQITLRGICAVSLIATTCNILVGFVLNIVSVTIIILLQAALTAMPVLAGPSDYVKGLQQ
jgi:hypothetical protein